MHPAYSRPFFVYCWGIDDIRIQRMSQEVDGSKADLTLRLLQTQSTLLHSLKEISQRLDVFIPVLRVAYYVIYVTL